MLSIMCYLALIQSVRTSVLQVFFTGTRYSYFGLRQLAKIFIQAQFICSFRVTLFQQVGVTAMHCVVCVDMCSCACRICRVTSIAYTATHSMINLESTRGATKQVDNQCPTLISFVALLISLYKQDMDSSFPFAHRQYTRSSPRSSRYKNESTWIRTRTGVDVVDATKTGNIFNFNFGRMVVVIVIIYIKFHVLISVIRPCNVHVRALYTTSTRGEIPFTS